MKLQFNPELDFQTVAPLHEYGDLMAGEDQSDLGIGNRLRLLDEDILKNVN